MFSDGSLPKGVMKKGHQSTHRAWDPKPKSRVYFGGFFDEQHRIIARRKHPLHPASLSLRKQIPSAERLCLETKARKIRILDS